MTSSLDQHLRDLVAQEVRAEVRRAVADALRPDEYISPATAAKMAEVTPETIRRWVKAGKLQRYGVKGEKKRTRVLRVSRLELERLLRADGARNDEQLTPEQLAERRFG